MNEELLGRLMAAETPAEVQAIVKEYDIELSDEDAARLISELEEIRAFAVDDEVSDEELVGVTGGISFSSVFKKAKSFFNVNKDSIIGAVSGAVGGWMGTKK